MLTNNLLSYYNHLLATTLIYFTLNEPLQEISERFGSDIQKGDRQSFITLAVAGEPEITQDLYEILGVEKAATKNEIHKAFRQLAKKYHPDKNKEKGAQDEFIKIFKAYETLSDEKKRKEYDERSKASNHGSPYGGWQTTNSMNDFDINDFFKQYEDQIFRHAQYHGQHNQNHYQQHHNQHNSHHDRFSFHGVNLDDLFHDIDEDEFGRLFEFAGQHHGHNHHNHLHEHHNHYDSDGTFGDGNSYFGSHFPSQLHDTIHQYQHHQNIYSAGGSSAGYSCHTVTKQVNGMVMTQTSCV